MLSPYVWQPEPARPARPYQRDSWWVAIAAFFGITLQGEPAYGS